MTKLIKIFLNMVPVLVMIGLIPLIKNDYFLTLACVVVIVISFTVKRERKEFIIFISGFVLMIIFEYFFISTGAETFNRNSLFGIMPLWLPFIWGYGFVAIKRVTTIIEEL